MSRIRWGATRKSVEYRQPASRFRKSRPVVASARETGSEDASNKEIRALRSRLTVIPRTPPGPGPTKSAMKCSSFGAGPGGRFRDLLFAGGSSPLARYNSSRSVLYTLLWPGRVRSRSWDICASWYHSRCVRSRSLAAASASSGSSEDSITVRSCSEIT